MIEIKVSLPKVEFARKKWLDAIASKQRAKSLPGLRKLFKETVNGWSKKPDFGWAQIKTGDSISINVYPTGEYAEIWNLVNEGAPAHPIDPKKNGGLLRFRPGYRAATRPGQLRSGRSYRSGKHVTAKRVIHPGFEPRRFTELIAQEFAERYGMEMQEAVSEVANR